jgi:hypothetical protein
MGSAHICHTSTKLNQEMMNVHEQYPLL